METRNSKVILDWMGNISWKQQCVIISGLRGPDNHYSPHLKRLVRWMRRATQNNADPDHSYMQNDDLPTLEEIEHEVVFCTIHYVSHLINALEIIGFKHSDKAMAKIAYDYYSGIVTEFFHLHTEKEEELDKRLRDKVNH